MMSSRFVRGVDRVSERFLFFRDCYDGFFNVNGFT
jgi:hypothetical protein